MMLLGDEIEERLMFILKKEIWKCFLIFVCIFRFPPNFSLHVKRRSVQIFGNQGINEKKIRRLSLSSAFDWKGQEI